MSLRLRRALVLLVWLGALALLTLYVTRALRVDTDLRAFMPPPQTPAQKLLLDEIGEGPGSRLLLLAIEGASQTRLAALSRGLNSALDEDPLFVRAANGSADLGQIPPHLLPYRYLLSPTLDRHRLDAAFLRDQLQQRLQDLGSPAASLLKPLLPRDPTLETLKLAQRWSPPQAPAMREGVWFSRDGRQALLVAETRAPGFDPNAQQRAQTALQQHFAALAGHRDARLIVSGPGAFTVRVNATTRTEANWIGTVDSIGFALLLLIAYRSIVTVGLGALPLLSGGLAGTAALALVFGGAHGITLAFGFTLIGVAQDYPIHLFSHRRQGETALHSARALWPVLLTGVASTCIAYLAFLASGVTGLQQLAVFTIVGLAVAALSTRFLLPRLLPERGHDATTTPGLGPLWRWLEGLPRPRWLAPALALAAVLAIALAPGMFWQNNLAALTPVPQDLLQRDARLRAELGAPDVRYLLVLQAPSADGVLALSEQMDDGLHRLVHQGALQGVELPSRYLPSAATQRARQARLPDRASLKAALATASRDMPFRAGLFQPFLADVQRARELPPLSVQAFADTDLGTRLASMLLQRDGHWLGLATLIGVQRPQAIAALAAQTHGAARLLDLKSASESLVVRYRTRILEALALAALLLTGVVALALRSRRRLLRVLAPMALTTLLILATLRLCGVPLSLFHLIALILAAGLGLDYALFFEHVEDSEPEQLRTLHAVLVCSISTFFVFMMLALSSLPVLRAIGVTVTLGIGFNFLLAILITRERRRHVAEV